MSLSRRAFVRVLGLGGAGTLAGSVGSGYESRAGVAWALNSMQPMNRRYDAGFINLSSNSNPRGPGKAVLEALRGRISHRVGRYPDNVGDLSAAIAALIGAKPENILLSTGSGEELVGAARAFVTAARPLVTGAPSYEDPERTSKTLGLPVKPVPVDSSLRLDLDAMATAAKAAGLVYVCNPNNPTAMAHSASAIAEFVKRVKSASPDTAILIDEAYIDYAKDPSVATAVPLALEYPGVFMTRTFSKAYGLAGLRLGYAAAQPGTIKRLSEAWGFGSVNVLTAAAALAGLDDTEHLRAEIAENARVRQFTLSALKEMGYSATDSETNFVWVNVRRPSKEFRDLCFKLGVLVGRDFPTMPTYSRISLGTMEEMRQAVEIFRKVPVPLASAAGG